MRWWDESMFAVNTYEMMQNGKWFSLYYNGAVDLFNTKPPLTNWLQILSVKIGGYNELSLRIPSAIATTLSILVLFKFLSEKLSVLMGWCGALVLLTSFGFIHFHTGRTADSDALLSFFVLMANLCFANFILGEKKRHVMWFFVFITLAFLVKLYAALLFVPAYIFFLFYKKRLREFVLSWQFLIGVLFFVLSIGSLFYLRELDAPGYLNEILFKDAGRMLHVVENHNERLFFYIDNLFKTRFSIWFMFFIVGAVCLFIYAEKRNTILHLFIAFVVSYLVIIMISVTKLEWYDMPLYPYLSAVAAYPIYLGIGKFKKSETGLTTTLKYFILAVIFIYPYSMMFKKSQRNEIRLAVRYKEANERFLHNKIKEDESLDGVTVFHSDWNGALLFYKYKLTELGQNLMLCNEVEKLKTADKVLVNTPELKAELEQRFVIKLIEQNRNAELYELITKE